MSRVIVITGPCGAGKTTVSRLVASQLNAEYLNGDDVKEQLFPGLVNITEHPEKLAAVKKKLLEQAASLFSQGNTIVVDYVVLGSYIEDFKNTFGDSFVIKVLLPSAEVNMHRDTHRDCWTAGQEHLTELRSKFLRDEKLIGKEHFIDNSDQSPEETASEIIDYL